MKFDEWRVWYHAILKDFGFRKKEDRETSDILDRVISESSAVTDPPDLDFVRGSEVAVVGDASSLESEIRRTDLSDYVVVASDGASTTILNSGYIPDIVVSDLDGAPETAVELSREGVPVAVHAHGDNQELVERWLPEFDLDNVVGTTQTDPSEFRYLRNYGGFTDGDRAAYLAHHHRARSIELVGWEFDDPHVSVTKHRKLRWAWRLLKVLSYKRDEKIV